MPEELEAELRALIQVRAEVVKTGADDEPVLDGGTVSCTVRAIEDVWGVTVPQALLGLVQTQAELVGVIAHLIRRGRRAQARRRPLPEAVPAAVVIVPAGGGGRILRSGWLTPYEAEELADETLRFGPGTSLEITVAPGCSEHALAMLVERFAWLRERQVSLVMRRARPDGDEAQDTSQVVPSGPSLSTIP